MATSNAVARYRYNTLRGVGLTAAEARRFRYVSQERFNTRYRQAVSTTRRGMRNAARRSRYQQARAAGLEPQEANRAAGRTGQSFQTTVAAYSEPVITTRTATRPGLTNAQQFSRWSSARVDVPDSVQKVVENYNYQIAMDMNLPFTSNQEAYERQGQDEGKLYADSSPGWFFLHRSYVLGRTDEEIRKEMYSDDKVDYYL